MIINETVINDNSLSSWHIDLSSMKLPDTAPPAFYSIDFHSIRSSAENYMKYWSEMTTPLRTTERLTTLQPGLIVTSKVQALR